jgi:hypothetical protein
MQPKGIIGIIEFDLISVVSFADRLVETNNSKKINVLNFIFQFALITTIKRNYQLIFKSTHLSVNCQGVELGVQKLL